MVFRNVLTRIGASRLKRIGVHVLQGALVVSAFMVSATPAAGQSSQGSTGQYDAPPDQPPPATSDDRLFWTLPNFLTVKNAGVMRPLTAGEKYDVVFRSSFDYVEFGWYAVLAGISQAQNASPTDGRGFSGFAKRFGTAFADGSIDNFMVGAIFPSLLKEDPRYFQLGEGSAWHRVEYSVSRLIVTRSDRGRQKLNVSELLGTAATAGLATAYRPGTDRTMRTVASVWATQLAYDGLALTLKEFWPDIRRKVSHR